MIERTLLPAGGRELPAFRARGAADGPHLALVAGGRGCEYSAAAAVIRVVQELDPGELSGSLVAVPVVALDAYLGRAPAPAAPQEAVAELAAGADALLDLRGGGVFEALEPFAVHADRRSQALATSLGLPCAVADGGLAPALGVPCAAAYGGGGGLLEEAVVRRLAGAVRNGLRHLEMLPGRPDRAHVRHGRVERVGAPAGGWWVAAVRPGEEVQEGTLLGRVRDLWGDVVSDVRSPADAVVLSLTTGPPVDAGATVVALAVP